MPQYAKNTKVNSDISRLDIEKTLMRYGADNFAYAKSQDKAIIGFTIYGRQGRIVMPFPAKEEFALSPTGKKRTENIQLEAYEQACKQRWRILHLVIKAKLEAIECKVSVFEDEFMANIVLPGGNTVGDFMRPQIEQAYLCGAMPAMLPMLEEHK